MHPNFSYGEAGRTRRSERRNRGSNPYLQSIKKLKKLELISNFDYLKQQEEINQKVVKINEASFKRRQSKP